MPGSLEEQSEWVERTVRYGVILDSMFFYVCWIFVCCYSFIVTGTQKEQFSSVQIEQPNIMFFANTSGYVVWFGCKRVVPFAYIASGYPTVFDFCWFGLILQYSYIIGKQESQTANKMCEVYVRAKIYKTALIRF